MEHQDITLPADVLRQVPSLLLRGVLVALIERADSNGVVTIKVNSVCEEWELTHKQLRLILQKLERAKLTANLGAKLGPSGGTTLKVLNIQRYVKIYYYGKVSEGQICDQYQEKERKQEKERFPHTPSKEKEINKEKEWGKNNAREQNFERPKVLQNANTSTPTREAVIAYIVNGEAAMVYPGNKRELANSFYDHYNSIGWIDGYHRTIVNWKCRADSWVRNAIEKIKSQKTTPRNETYQTDRLARRRGTETSAQSAEDYEDTL